MKKVSVLERTVYSNFLKNATEKLCARDPRPTISNFHLSKIIIPLSQLFFYSIQLLIKN